MSLSKSAVTTLAQTIDSARPAALVMLLSLGGQTAWAGFVFGEPTLVPVDGVAEVAYPQVSHDGLELYFCSARNGRPDLWLASRKKLADKWSDPKCLGFPTRGTDDAAIPGTTD